MGRRISALVLALILVTVFVLAACGRIDAGIHTTFKPSGLIVQSISLTGSGQMGTSLSNAFPLQTYITSGWLINVASEGGSTTVSATRVFRKDDISNIMAVFLKSDRGASGIKNPVFTITDNFFIKYYSLSFTIPPMTPDTIDTGAGEQWAKLGEAALDSMFSLTWSITLPGQITATNADSYQRDTATYNFKYSTLKNGRQVMVQSRYVDWPLILIVLGGVVVVVLIIVFATKPKPAIKGDKPAAGSSAQPPSPPPSLPSSPSDKPVG
ncbi:MAG: hypothetical protein WC541_10185 [Dehalococcoidia bacterium]